MKIFIIILIIYLLYQCYYSYEYFTEQENSKKLVVTADIQTNLLYTLKTIDMIFNEHNIWYNAAYGTLLGGIRHWGLIPWDDDGDLLIQRKDVDNIMSLKDEFKKNGLYLEKDWKLIKVYMNVDKYPFVDLFINEDIDGKFLRCMEPFTNTCHYPNKNQDWWWKYVGYPSSWVMERKRIKFDNFELWAPIKSLDLLKFWYGNDVLTTCKTHDYDHITDQYITPVSIPCSNLPRPQI